MQVFLFGLDALWGSFSFFCAKRKKSSPTPPKRKKTNVFCLSHTKCTPPQRPPKCFSFQRGCGETFSFGTKNQLKMLRTTPQKGTPKNATQMFFFSKGGWGKPFLLAQKKRFPPQKQNTNKTSKITHSDHIRVPIGEDFSIRYAGRRSDEKI